MGHRGGASAATPAIGASASATPSGVGAPPASPTSPPRPSRSTCSDGTRRRHRLVRAGAVHGRRRGDRVADALPGHRRGHRALRHRSHGRSASPARAAPTTWPARRSRSSATSRPPAPGRRSRRATWRWTARGRSTRRGCGSSTATSTRPSCSPPGISSRGDLREVLCLQNDPYYLMPLWADHVSLAALQARAWLDAGRRHRGRPRRGGGAQPPQRPRQPVRAGARRRHGRGHARRAAGRGAAPRRRLPAGRPTAPPRWCSWPATGPARCASGRRGSAASTTASSRTTRACATSPRASRRGSPASTSGVGDAPIEVAELVGHLQPRGADPARRRSGWATTSR